MARTKHKNKQIRYLPFSYTESDRKQARLYLILIHLIDRNISPEDFEFLRNHLYYRLRNYPRTDREDIFSDFILSIARTDTALQVWHTNLFIQQRLTNAIKKHKKQKSKYILVENLTLDTL